MNKRRLLKLADLLEADAKNENGVQFDLAIWGRVSGAESNDIASCGTMACAVGLAAISGAFARGGLGYRIVETEWGHREIKVTLNGRCRGVGPWDGSFVNACKFWGLTHDEGEFLFTPYAYDRIPRAADGERIVAKRIRDFVAGKATP